ncbi:hypothetical protein [Dyadobacter sp. CY347]|uniref:hypothetical protein n=1 Tax=Dyadobacter sp. CY347 TaxID=2909336 RepID=UPI001F190E13|nr:hypothetical protein [Dyadobacter sp. CY347]MCF2488924.1 hypothetical protein [Dyadobacter sp. CY347]
MNLKISTIILSSVILGGTITTICLSIGQSRLPEGTLNVNAVNVETASHCKYVYDELAHKLVAYSATEKCAADRGFSFKIGSRILELTKGSLRESQPITL